MAGAWKWADKMLGLQIANLVEIFSEDHHQLSFDVTVNGHQIATITIRCEGSRLLWHAAKIEGFDDFTLRDRDLIEERIREERALKPFRNSLH